MSCFHAEIEYSFECEYILLVNFQKPFSTRIGTTLNNCNSTVNNKDSTLNVHITTVYRRLGYLCSHKICITVFERGSVLSFIAVKGMLKEVR